MKSLLSKSEGHGILGWFTNKPKNNSFTFLYWQLRFYCYCATISFLQYFFFMLGYIKHCGPHSIKCFAFIIFSDTNICAEMEIKSPWTKTAKKWGFTLLWLFEALLQLNKFCTIKTCASFQQVKLGPGIMANNKTSTLLGRTVVAHLVKWLLLTPEIRGSNPVIVNFYFLTTMLKWWNYRKRVREFFIGKNFYSISLKAEFWNNSCPILRLRLRLWLG